jgi:hypothetical protein
MAVGLDLVPVVGRPDGVARLLDEALALRARHRDAQEHLAAAQAELERQQEADVASAAERIRAGSEPGAVPPAIGKARHAVELAQRNAAAIGLASDAAQADLITSMTTTSAEWLTALDAAGEQARERAVAALDQFDAAAREIGATASATAWVRSGVEDGRFDRRPPQMLVGTVAPSSRRATANSEPLAVPDLVAWLRESIEPTASPALVETAETV